jgi:hypothetical protein
MVRAGGVAVRECVFSNNPLQQTAGHDGFSAFNATLCRLLLS